MAHRSGSLGTDSASSSTSLQPIGNNPNTSSYPKPLTSNSQLYNVSSASSSNSYITASSSLPNNSQSPAPVSVPANHIPNQGLGLTSSKVESNISNLSATQSFPSHHHPEHTRPTSMFVTSTSFHTRSGSAQIDPLPTPSPQHISYSTSGNILQQQQPYAVHSKDTPYSSPLLAGHLTNEASMGTTQLLGRCPLQCQTLHQVEAALTQLNPNFLVMIFWLHWTLHRKFQRCILLKRLNIPLELSFIFQPQFDNNN